MQITQSKVFLSITFVVTKTLNNMHIIMNLHCCPERIVKDIIHMRQFSPMSEKKKIKIGKKVYLLFETAENGNLNF